MPERVRSGRRLHAMRWSQRPKFVQGSVKPVAILGAHTAYTLKRGEVYLDVSNAAWCSLREDQCEKSA